SIQLGNLSRVLAEEMRPQFRDPGTGTIGVGGQIERAQRANLAIAGEPLVGVYRYDRAVEDGYRLTAGPFVTPLVQGQFDTVRGNPTDFHRVTIPQDGVRMIVGAVPLVQRRAQPIRTLRNFKERSCCFSTPTMFGTPCLCGRQSKL